MAAMHRCMPPCIHPAPFAAIATTAQPPLLLWTLPLVDPSKSTRSNVRVECQLFLSALSLYPPYNLALLFNAPLCLFPSLLFPLFFARSGSLFLACSRQR